MTPGRGVVLASKGAFFTTSDLWLGASNQFFGLPGPNLKHVDVACKSRGLVPELQDRTEHSRVPCERKALQDFGPQRPVHAAWRGLFEQPTAAKTSSSVC